MLALKGPVLSDRRVQRVACAALAACLLSLTLASSAPASARAVERFVSVIVQSLGGSDEARSAVESVGGEVTLDLPIVNGVSARVPQSSVDQLERSPLLRISEDENVAFHKAFDGSKTAHQLTKVTNSSKLVENGIDGSGVTVALLDTGVYNHPDLAGRVIACKDFSHEQGTEAECADTFGHGTFMAGQIAGNGASSGGKYIGSAPAANIVSVKLAGFDGSTDVSHVLAGIQWAVAHKDTYGIDVMSLSLGTNSAQDYRLSPLNFAVEKAWQSGIVVVVSAGNTGPDGKTISKPGDDPWVITVGAENHEGTVDIKDDMVPVFSGRGPTRSNGLAKPDIVAPGVHTVSLRSPGSAVDQKFCETACVGDSYFKGTGTSMATAYMSGIVAQLLEANPGLNPNQVKHRLMSTARQISETDTTAVGAGLVDAHAAATSTSTQEANQGLESSTGLGLLTGARGSLGIEVTTPFGSVGLTGEFTAQWDEDLVSLTNPLGLVTFDATNWNATNWNATNWNATNWNTAGWAGTNWNGTNWNGTNWNNSDWDATNWNATNWNELDWDATNWNATNWNSAWYAVAWG